MKPRSMDKIGAALFLLAVWYMAVQLVDKPFLPGPWLSIRTFFALLAEGELLRHFAVSCYRIIAGTLAGLALALPVGLAMGYNQTANRLLSPLFHLLYPVPKVVFLPVIIVLMGLGNAPKIFLIAFVLFFQLAVVIADAAKALPGEQIDSIRSLNAGRGQILRHLILPGCMPGIMTSLRASLGVSTALLFIAETYASFAGLGYFIVNRMDIRSYEEMYAGIMALALLGAGLYVAVDLLERRLCKWQYAAAMGGTDRAESS